MKRLKCAAGLLWQDKLAMLGVHHLNITTQKEVYYTVTQLYPPNNLSPSVTHWTHNPRKSWIQTDKWTAQFDCPGSGIVLRMQHFSIFSKTAKEVLKQVQVNWLKKKKKRGTDRYNDKNINNDNNDNNKNNNYNTDIERCNSTFFCLQSTLDFLPV